MQSSTSMEAAVLADDSAGSGGETALADDFNG